jgi:hypothetical protein
VSSRPRVSALGNDEGFQIAFGAVGRSVDAVRVKQPPEQGESAPWPPLMVNPAESPLVAGAAYFVAPVPYSEEVAQLAGDPTIIALDGSGRELARDEG